MAKYYTAEELGLNQSSEDQEPVSNKKYFTAEEIGLTPQKEEKPKESKKFLTAEDIGLPPEEAPKETAKEELKPPTKPSGWTRRLLGDQAVTLAQGAVGLRQMISGVEDLISLGYIGKAKDTLRDFYKSHGLPVPPSDEDIRTSLENLKSPQRIYKTQEADIAASEAAKGKPWYKAIPAATLEYAKRPEAALDVVEQSLPSMIGSEVAIGRNLLPKVFPKLGAVGRSAISEGSAQATSMAEQTRLQNEDRALTLKQEAASIISGILTGTMGAFGGKVAQKLGLTDIDTLIVGATSKTATAAEKQAAKSVLAQTIKSSLAESTLEELPQSMQEQIAQNYATGRPWNEGVAEAGAKGLIAGLITAAPITAYTQNKENQDIYQKQKEELHQQTLDDQQQKANPTRDAQIKSIFADLDSQAKQTLAEKQAEADKLKSAKQAQVVNEAQDLESMPAPDQGILTDTTLTSWGLNKNSKAYKQLIGKDVSTPDGRKLMEDTLDAHTGKLNEQAVSTFTNILDQKAEAVDAGLDTGTTTISDAISGGQKYGTPGGTQGRFGPTTNISGSVAGLTQTGEETSDDTLAAKAEDTSPKIPGFKRFSIKKADGTISEGWTRDNATEVDEQKDEQEANANEVLKTEEDLAPDFQVDSQEVKVMKRMGVLLRTLDPTNPLVESLLDGTANEDAVATAQETINNLKESRKAKKVDLTKPSEIEREEFNVEDTDLGTNRELQPEVVASTAKAKTLGQALNIIQNEHGDKTNDAEKSIIKKLLNIPNLVHTKYQTKKLNKFKNTRIGGTFNSLLNKVTLDTQFGNVKALIHEAVHSATVAALRKAVYTTHHVNKKLKQTGMSVEDYTISEHVGRTEAGKRMVKIYNAALQNWMQNDKILKPYGLKDIFEFTSEALSNPEFQKFLADIPSVEGGKAQISSLWTDFVEAVKKLLNLGDISNTLLNDVLSVAPELMQGPKRGIFDRIKDEASGAESFVYEQRTEKEMDDLHSQTGQKRRPRVPKQTKLQKFAAAPVQSTGQAITNFRKWAFSFDFAINKKILDAMRKSGVSMVDLAKAHIALEISQALHVSDMGDAFLERGNIKFNPKLFKFLITNSRASMKNIRDRIDKLAKQKGIDPVKMFEYASSAFIAKRSKGLNAHNDQLKTDVLKLLNKGKRKEANDKLAKDFKLVHMTEAEIQAGLEILNEYPELNEVFDMWNDVRAKVLNFAKDMGLYNTAGVEQLLEIMDYVPFNRVFEDEEGERHVGGRKEYTRGLLDAARDPKFKGSYREINNVFDNMDNWVKYIIKKGINNQAAKTKIDFYKQFIPDDIKKTTGQKRGPMANTNSVQIWENVIVNGEERNVLNRYDFQGFDAKDMVDGFTGLEPALINGLRDYSGYTHWLRQNIVLYPLFSLSQVFQDTISALTLSGVKYPVMLPLQVIKEIALSPMGLSKARKRLKEAVIVGSHDYSKEYDRIDKLASEDGKKYKTWRAIKKAALSPFTALAMGSDNVIRQAIYAQTMLETNNEALAMHRAAEIINFRRTGSGQIINIMRQLVPFVGANLQALHVSGATVFGEGITPDTRWNNFKRFVLNGSQVMILTLLYCAMMSDDDDYKKLDPSERDSFFILPGGYKIPMRTDFSGLFFKTFAEHLYQRFIERSEDNRKMNKALQAGLIKALSIPSAMPAITKPAVEATLNYNFYTKRPLIGQGQEGLEPELQYSPKHTTQLAMLLGENSGVSPLVYDNAIRELLGSTAAVINFFTENMIADMRGETLPDKTLREKLLMLPNFNSFLVKQYGAREMNDLYELNDEVNKAYQSYKQFEKLAVDEKGQKEFEEYIKSKQNLIDLQPTMQDISQQLKILRDYEKQVITDSAIKGPEKRKILNDIEEQRRDMLKYEVDREDQSKTRNIQQLREQAGFNE
jgi:hypothetical protein